MRRGERFDCLRVVIALACAAGWGIAGAQTTVIHDGTLSPGVIDISSTGYNILQSNGVTKGGNLFHSFSQFDVGSAQPVTFTGAGVNNIIARVTGGSLSTIDGTVNSAIPGANLFLMNPSGVMFGPNAVIDLSGAFVATTADYIEFSDGFQFTAVPGAGDAILSTAPVSSFGFLGPGPSPISASGGIGTNGVTRFSLIGGDLTLTGATLQVPDANVDLVSSAGGGVVALDVTNPSSLPDTAGLSSGGDVMLTNSTVQTSGTGAGRIVIRGGELTLDNAFLNAATPGSGDSLGIDIAATGDVLFTRGSNVISTGFGSGDAGPIRITARNLTMRRGGGFPVTVSANSTGVGDAGDIDVNVAGSIYLREGALLSSNTFGVGAGGDVGVTAGNLVIAGGGELTGIVAQTANAAQGGDIRVDVSNSLRVSGGGRISSSAFGTGDGGNTTVEAGSIVIDAGGGGVFTGIAARTNAAGTGGDGGDVRVSADGELRLLDGGVITSDTANSGAGGSIIVDVGSLVADGSGGSANTGINALQSGNASGASGDIVVYTRGDIRLIGGGQIDSSTFGSGNAGDIRVTAGNVTIDRAGRSLFTGIGSDSDGSGNGGTIDLTTGNLAIRRGGLISTGALSSGDGGTISVRASTIGISGSGVADPTLATEKSAIFAGTRAGSTGQGGSLDIRSNSIVISDDGLIGVEGLGAGNAGNMRISANLLTLANRGGISARASVDGGNIELFSSGIVRLDSSFLIAEAQNDGGNITIQRPFFVILDDSRISANAVNGTGGNIFIGSDYLLLNNSEITASSQFGVDGTVRIDAVFDLSSTLGELDAALLNDGQNLQPRCTARIPGQTGSFIIVGRGGQPVLPGSFQPSHQLLDLPD